MTITPERAAIVDFTRPLLTNVNEVIVTGPAAPPIKSLEDLRGLEIFVRPSSSYEQHLRVLIQEFDADASAPPIIRAVDELLEAEDLMEMVDAGLLPATVMDDYKAVFWSEVFPNVEVREDLIVNQGGSIAWAVRKDSPELKALLNEFLRKYGRGTLFGNVVYDRYLSDVDRVRCAVSGKRSDDVEEMARLFRKYGELYDFDWLMLAAQAYQESGLRQNRRSQAGAVGVMQVRPSTAADRNVGVENIDRLENNIHAGTKYMRFLADRYFGDDMDPVNRWLFSLAAYNAGPARIARIRREAAKQGHDRDQWFDQVEITVAHRIGRETVHYVGNIYKYYVVYSLASAKGTTQAELYGAQLGGCAPEAS
jgi:membrane-bound lytic murein transglycosylase MltF